MADYRLNSLKSLYFKFSGILFCAFIILLYVFTKNYAVVSYSLKVTLICIYFAISTILLFGMYKSKGEIPNLVAALTLPILMIPMVIKPLLLIPLIGLIFLYFKFKKWRMICSIALVIFVVLYCIAGFLSFLASIFSGMVLVTDVQKVQSPNGQYMLILQESDEGALGGSVSVLIENNIIRKSFAGIVKRKTDLQTGRKELYYGHWGERPKISWLDNKTVEINGRKFNIFKYEEWINKK